MSPPPPISPLREPTCRNHHTTIITQCLLRELMVQGLVGRLYVTLGTSLSVFKSSLSGVLNAQGKLEAHMLLP